VVGILGDEPKAALDVEVARRGKGTVRPQPDVLISGGAGEIQASADESAAEVPAAGVGMDEQDPQQRGRLVLGVDHAGDADHSPPFDLGDPSGLAGRVVIGGVVGDDPRHERLEAPVPAELRLVQALLARARQDEPALLERARASGAGQRDPVALASELWSWLAADEHRALLKLWVEGCARSLIDSDGPCAGFAATTVADWLDLLGEVTADAGERTLILAVLRGALLDLLATGELERVSDAVNRQLALLRAAT
jgi:hypothetical protein